MNILQTYKGRNSSNLNGVIFNRISAEFIFAIIAVICLLPLQNAQATIIKYEFKGAVDYIDPSLTSAFSMSDEFVMTVSIDTNALPSPYPCCVIYDGAAIIGSLETSFSGLHYGNGGPFAIKNPISTDQYDIVIQDIDYLRLGAPYTVDGATYSLGNTLILLTDLNNALPPGPFGYLPALNDFEMATWELQVSPSALPPPPGHDSGEISGHLTSITIVPVPEPTTFALLALGLSVLGFSRCKQHM